MKEVFSSIQGMFSARKAWDNLTTNEASVFKYFLFLLFLTPQIGKCINDDAKDEVQNDDDHNKEEQEIVNNPRHVKGFLGNKQKSSKQIQTSVRKSYTNIYSRQIKLIYYCWQTAPFDNSIIKFTVGILYLLFLSEFENLSLNYWKKCYKKKNNNQTVIVSLPWRHNEHKHNDIWPSHNTMQLALLWLVCCVMQVSEPSVLIVKKRGSTQCIYWQHIAPQRLVNYYMGLCQGIGIILHNIAPQTLQDKNTECFETPIGWWSVIQELSIIRTILVVI